MAKIVRFSGYAIDPNEEYDGEDLKIYIENNDSFFFQQLHTEESENFEWDDDLEINKLNCDLAYLTQYFKKDIPLNYDRPLPITGQKYRHFKVGKIVTVIGISRHTETEEISVVYDYEGKIWNRPLDMFMSEVDKNKYPNATQKYRLELVESD